MFCFDLHITNKLVKSCLLVNRTRGAHNWRSVRRTSTDFIRKNNLTRINNLAKFIYLFILKMLPHLKAIIFAHWMKHFSASELLMPNETVYERFADLALLTAL